MLRTYINQPEYQIITEELKRTKILILIIIYRRLSNRTSQFMTLQYNVVIK